MSDSKNTTPAGEDESPLTESPENDGEGTEEPDGVGKDNTIPNDPEGVAAGYTGRDSTFEPEEDPPATN